MVYPVICQTRERIVFERPNGYQYHRKNGDDPNAEKPQISSSFSRSGKLECSETLKQRENTTDLCGWNYQSSPSTRWYRR